MRCYTLADGYLRRGLQTAGYHTYCPLDPFVEECGVTCEIPDGWADDNMEKLIQDHHPDCFLLGHPWLIKPTPPTKSYPASVILLEIETLEAVRLKESGDQGMPVMFKPGRTLMMYFPGTCVIQYRNGFVINPHGGPEFTGCIKERKIEHLEQEKILRNRESTIMLTI